jgi:hypothetical protein
MMELPPSPSVSEAPTTPDETQAPIPSTRDSLSSYGISIETAEQWKCRYNRQEVRVMDDEDFWKLVAQSAKECPADIESRLKSSIDEKSTCLRRDFEDVSPEVLLSGHQMSLTSVEKFAFASSLSQEIIIHRNTAFMTYCLPHLIKLAQTSKANHQKQKKTIPGQKRKSKAQEQNNKSLEHKQPVPQKVSKRPSGATKRDGTRRSRRIAKRQGAAPVE